MIRRFLSALTLVFTFNVHAEPWLASRYANNCAACHSTGRVNVEPAKEKRCTWTCQGCHTNPNGGGLRNSYGKWNQERWLRTKYIPSYRLNKPRPDLKAEQPYAADKLKDFLAKNQDPKLLKRAITEGFRLKETPRVYPETEYGRQSSDEQTVEPDLELARLRIPEGDPWRVRRDNFFNAGMDMRYIYLDQDTESNGTNTSTESSYLMATDVGVSAEPFKKITMVVESRFLNGPARKAWDEGFSSGAQVKSAYVMIDDLPYNAYIMHGLYRPMFGHYNPDFNTLFAYATGINQTTYYRATTVGAAPRVPFFNMHYIQPLGDSSSADKKQDQGFAVNLGARWATWGLYFMGSFWKTTADYRPSGGVIIDHTMQSLTGGATFGRWSLNFDYTINEKDQKSVRADKGTVLTWENRVRMMRENYVLLNYELLNTDLQLLAGDSRQVTLGWSSFLVASLELQLLYKQLKVESTTTTNDQSTKMIVGQVHLFF